VSPDTVGFVHILAAAGLTYTIGFERDLRGAGAGDRVFALIGTGAGVVGVLASHGAPAALTGVLTGVGFLGAGLLFRQEHHPEYAKGLTTAAAILAAVAIGAAAGEGRLLIATVATAVALLVLEARYIPALRVLHGGQWSSRFRHEPGRPPRSEAHRAGERPAPGHAPAPDKPAAPGQPPGAGQSPEQSAGPEDPDADDS
jgi:putative Mg2+ transporter-C (MgtC) family protein